MVPIISFIGWQNSGKTTLIKKVVTRLKEKGLRVAVIKATHHENIVFDRPGSDTDTYSKAGADSVSLIAPDQIVTMADRPDMKLVDIVNRYFYDYDLVIGEGFKDERHITKIEVNRDNSELLKDKINGVVALVTDQQLTDDNVFLLEQDKELADFIINSYINVEKQTLAVLYVNGKKIPLKGFVQDALAGSVGGFVRTLKKTDSVDDIDLKIRFA